MTVNKIPVLCNNCAFSFNSSLSVDVTSAQLVGYSLAFSLSNPNNISFALTDIQVSFLNRPCIVLTGTSSNFNCYFANDTSGNSLIPSGTGIPVVNIRGVGYANTASVTPITVDIVLTNFSPNVAGPEGNIPASVVGSGFPVNNDNNEIVISLCGNLVINYTSFSNT